MSTTFRQPLSAWEVTILTLYENWSKNMCGLGDQPTFSCNADCSQRIVTRDHSTCQMSGPEGLDCGCRTRFELILEDNEAKEPKP